MSDAIIAALITGGVSLAGVIISNLLTARKNEAAVFENAQGGEPLEVVELEASVDCHEGVIPLWWEGKLLRGMDVTASVLLKSGAKANA